MLPWKEMGIFFVAGREQTTPDASVIEPSFLFYLQAIIVFSFI